MATAEPRASGLAALRHLRRAPASIARATPSSARALPCRLRRRLSPCGLRRLDERIRIAEVERRRRVEHLDVLRGELELGAREVLRELLGVARAEDDGGDLRLCQQPREADSRGRGSDLARDGTHRVDDLPVALGVVAREAILHAE